MSPAPSLAVIACAVLEAEVRHLVRDCPQVRDVTCLPQGLHNEPGRLRRELQLAIDRAEARPDVEAIVLVYGLCSRGVEDLRHPRCPLVIARAHDCITLFLGDKDRYAARLGEHPGTYWYTPGWIKHHAPPGPDHTAWQQQEYAKKFTPEEVEYLLAVEQEGLVHYDRAAYVDLGVGDTEGALAYTRQCAACLGWKFEQVPGDITLLRDLLAGAWDERRFLVVPPNHTIALTADERIVRAHPFPPA